MLNHRDCGLRFKPKYIDLNFDGKCFLNNYPNITILDTEGNKIIEKSVNKVQNRILKGQRAGYAEAPWAVYISYNILKVYRGQACSGVLITFEWVLTAGHCVDE